MRKIVKQLSFCYNSAIITCHGAFLNVEETKMPTFTYKKAQKASYCKMKLKEYKLMSYCTLHRQNNTSMSDIS